MTHHDVSERTAPRVKISGGGSNTRVAVVSGEGGQLGRGL